MSSNTCYENRAMPIDRAARQTNQHLFLEPISAEELAFWERFRRDKLIDWKALLKKMHRH